MSKRIGKRIKQERRQRFLPLNSTVKNLYKQALKTRVFSNKTSPALKNTKIRLFSIF